MNSKLVLPCGDLRIVFWWADDRFAHRAEIRHGDQWLPSLESIEGNANDLWPPSPALQGVHLEDRARGQVALLVGMSGASHWSASVEADPGCSTVVFDVACRISGEPGWLGSSYRRLSPEPGRRLQLDAGSLQVEDRSPNLILLAPRDGAALPRTILWRYVLKAQGVRTP